jgi:mannosyltransferase OCH1-like enzyme
VGASTANLAGSMPTGTVAVTVGVQPSTQHPPRRFLARPATRWRHPEVQHKVTVNTPFVKRNCYLRSHTKGAGFTLNYIAAAADSAIVLGHD